MYISLEMGVEVSKEKKDASRKIKIQLREGGLQMWLHELISLQVRDGNIYTSLPIPKPVVSCGGFFTEDTWFESQPVLTDLFPSFPPGKSHDRDLK